jgi:hypothetical protein
MEAQRAEFDAKQQNMMRMVQQTQAQLESMRREQSNAAELHEELKALRRWHVEPLVYGRACIGSALPCSRDHPAILSSLKFAALQVALPQISDAGILALWEAGFTTWAKLMHGEAQTLAKVLSDDDAAALHEMKTPVSTQHLRCQCVTPICYAGYC